MYPWLKDAIKRNAVVITASRRLARDLQSAYAAQQTEAGVQTWVTPAISFWTDWCRLKLEACADPRPLPLPVDDFSSAILWQRCLRGNAPDGLPAMRGVERQARDAWQRIMSWKVPLSALKETARSPDEQMFVAAATQYQALLDASSWTDRDGMPGLVADLLSQRLVGIPHEIILAGFDRVVPALVDIIDALQAAGCKVQTAAAANTGAAARVASFDDHDAEMRAAGAWARSILQDEPDAKIAIISPDLQSNAERDARLAREGLAPGWQYAGAAWREAVNVSYGHKLDEFPAIAIALLVLRWLHHGLSTKEVSLLLRSKCLASAQCAGRSRLELLLRKLPDRAWSLRSLFEVLKGRDDSADSLAWFSGIEASIELQQEERLASPAHWASRMDALLNQWRWPGTSTPTSNEFQLINRWRDLLNELARTALITPQIRLQEAVERLLAIAGEVVFQPMADGGVVSLMGTLEAAGMEFDHLWISGMHAGLWPPAANPSPLLSRELQKEFDLPDATPADTLRFAQRVLQRLTNSAEAVVFSWPRTDGESELAASGLLDEIPHRACSDLADPGSHALQFCGTDTTAIIEAEPVPPVAADERVSGGAYTVQRQSVEPFAAFVYGRLGVTRPDAIETGIAPSVRGNIIHTALHTLFAERPTRADLRNWDADNLEQRLGSAIDSALASHVRHADETHTRLFSLERTRLFQLLRSFVAEEIDRSEFAILDVEKPIDSEAFGVRLSLRVDRIDRLADGSLLIIDYKTGRPRDLLNKDGDLKDLQLAVYADVVEGEVGGLVIINIDSRSISYKGTGGSVPWDAARQETWPERFEAWRDEVHQALREIAAGDVRVNLLLSADEARPLGILSRLEELKRAH
jgi:probable DNA repair protein